MIGWREAWWFRAVAALVVALMSGGFVRIVLGFVAEAAVADRAAVVVVGAVLFGFAVRVSLRGLRIERPPRLHVVREPEDDVTPE